MSSPDQAIEKKEVAAPTATPPAEAPEAPAAPAEKERTKEAQPGDAGDDSKGTEPTATEKPAEAAEPAAEPEKPAETAETEAQPEKSDDKDEKKADAEDVEMKDAPESAPEAKEEPAADEAEKKEEPAAGKAERSEEPAADKTEAQEESATDKAKASRRKSTGGSEPKGKKLNKKQSKARILNLNAQPGDHYLVKLKGFPPWPAVICDEDMLPGPIIASRPVTAKRADGTYREDFADGGKRANDRTFPVMYLYTNEFGWVPNTSLQELTPDQASAAINDKMRKDLQSAYELASEGNGLDFYKDVLQQFQEDLVAKEEAQKAKKKKAAAAAADEMDIDAVDKTPAKKSKKRKAEDEVATPQRSDSAKKPKIKLTGSSAKAAANGAATPKTQSASKSSKTKTKKASEKQETPVSKRPELTEEEKHERKVKEVYYLRHKLQKGLFPKEQKPKAEDMPAMAEFFTRLENFTEMDASILRATRIHKLPKAIMRLEAIPREEEFDFKTRSAGLLDKWNKILADAPPAEGASGGVNGAGEGKESSDAKAGANGTDKAEAEAKDTPMEEAEAKEESNGDAEKKTEEAVSEETKAPEAVEA